MIYGINFNLTEIPPHLKKYLRQRIRLPQTYCDLKGVATTEEDRDIMLIQANNGHRKLHVEKRNTRYGTIYGIYTYYL